MGALDPDLWREFGLGLVGAAAALAGLIFVAISINLREILTGPALTGRAAEAVMTLVFVLVACAVLLVPGLEREAVGASWLTMTAVLFGVLLRVELRAIPLYGPDQRAVAIGRIVVHQLVVLLFVIAGIAALTGLFGGLYWVAPAALWGIVVGVSDGWVLMIEILR